MTAPTPTPFQSSIAVPSYDLCIVDGSYLIHRILYASGAKGEPPFSEMMNSAGEPTGAVYGCLRVLRSVLGLTEFTTKDIMVIWDGRPKGLSCRRMEIYPQYKNRIDDARDIQERERSANHRKLLEDQRPILYQVLNALGVASVNIPYTEGDDVIGWATRNLPHRKIVISSDDRDYYQLISDNISVYRSGIPNPVLITMGNFKSYVGLNSPIRYLLSAAICGDGSDNITGIPDVGDTTANKVANQTFIENGIIRYSNIQEAIELLMLTDSRSSFRYKLVLDNLPRIVMRNLELMDLRLESVKDDSDKLIFWESYKRPRVVNDSELYQWFNKLEFKSFLSEYSSWVQPFRKLINA